VLAPRPGGRRRGVPFQPGPPIVTGARVVAGFPEVVVDHNVDIIAQAHEVVPGPLVRLVAFG